MALPLPVLDIEEQEIEIEPTSQSSTSTSSTTTSTPTSFIHPSLSPEIQLYLRDSIMSRTHQKKLVLFMLTHKTGSTPRSLTPYWLALLDSLGYTQEVLDKEQKRQLREKTQRKMYYLFRRMLQAGAVRAVQEQGVLSNGEEDRSEKEGKGEKEEKGEKYEFAEWCEKWREEGWDGRFGRPEGFEGVGFDDEESLKRADDARVHAAGLIKARVVKEKSSGRKVDTVGVAKAKTKIVRDKSLGGKAKAARGVAAIATVARTGYATPGDSFPGSPRGFAANELDINTDNGEMNGDEDYEVFDEPIPEGWEIRDGYVVKKVYVDSIGRRLILNPEDEGYFGPADGIWEEFLRPKTCGTYSRDDDLEKPEYLEVVAPQNKELRVGHCLGCTCSNLSQVNEEM